MNDLETKVFYLEREIAALNRAIKAEKRLADMVKVADMIEAMCDDEIAKLKARIDELEYEEPIEDEDGTIAHMKMLEQRAADTYYRQGGDREEPF